MTVTIEQFVNREVNYCVSYLVSSLAQGYGSVPSNITDLYDMTDQAQELASPIEDWEQAALDEGWTPTHEDTPEDYCCEMDIEPHYREVLEHWIVSTWLGEQLKAKGEKVDMDFAGMIVWARTTSGQGISGDSVIKTIYQELIAS